MKKLKNYDWCALDLLIVNDNWVTNFKNVANIINL